MVVEGQRVGEGQFQARYEVECWMAIWEKSREAWKTQSLGEILSCRLCSRQGTKGLLIRSQIRLKGFICVREIRNFLQPG